MRRLNRRRATDAFLVGTFVVSWITHEAGIVVHSVASLVFTAALVVHVRQNWAIYRRYWRDLRRRTSVADNALFALIVAVTINGFTLWIGGERWGLGHGVIAIVATLTVFLHLWHHRRSLRRVVGLGRKRETVRA